ncbi:hypothetical protein HPB48_009994 [Haemaphysalis longicornis]|uniref:Uncharacterized protein n=1 Tax=Haemaphysalis longicornis TaxID=44386 RepID=A0A9J6FXT4_HAELO|nr:hypothetical protein HPB48_009994 [Haemaphysalis longicornis]
MQQMAGNMGLLNPFIFNQFGAYGAYAQLMQQQAALMAAAQGGYMNPMAALAAAQIPQIGAMPNGLASPALTPTSGEWDALSGRRRARAIALPQRASSANNLNHSEESGASFFR